MPSSVNNTSPMAGFPSSSFKYSPLLHVRVLFVGFVQGLFAEAPPGCFHWTEDVGSSEIYVTDDTPIKLEKAGDRPSISFTRGPVRFHSFGLDDMQDYDWSTAKKTKSVLVPGTMSINCCSRIDIESEQIAWVVAEMIWLLRENLLRAGFFEIGREPQIGAPSPAGSIVQGDGADEMFCTSVSVPFQFVRSSSFTPLGKAIVNSIDIQLSAANSRVHSLGTTPDGHEYPVCVGYNAPPPFAPDTTDVYGGTPRPGSTRRDCLPTQPHPLNPSTSVVVKPARNNIPGVRPPSMGGVTLPITDPCGGQSNT